MTVVVAEITERVLLFVAQAIGVFWLGHHRLKHSPSQSGSQRGCPRNKMIFDFLHRPWRRLRSNPLVSSSVTVCSQLQSLTSSLSHIF